MKLKPVLLLIGLLASMTACSVSGVSNQAAAAKGKALFDAMIEGDMDKVMSTYSEKFFESRPPDQWRDHLESVRKQSGDIKSYEITRLSSDTRFSGKFFIFEYRNVRTNGTTWETLTMVNPIDTKDVELIAHKIKVVSKLN